MCIRDSNSYFGRLNYDFLGKYFATATLRADGSSKFGINNRWGYFCLLYTSDAADERSSVDLGGRRILKKKKTNKKKEERID